MEEALGVVQFDMHVFVGGKQWDIALLKQGFADACTKDDADR